MRMSNRPRQRLALDTQQTGWGWMARFIRTGKDWGVRDAPKSLCAVPVGGKTGG